MRLFQDFASNLLPNICNLSDRIFLMVLSVTTLYIVFPSNSAKDVSLGSVTQYTLFRECVLFQSFIKSGWKMSKSLFKWIKQS